MIRHLETARDAEECARVQEELTVWAKRQGIIPKSREVVSRTEIFQYCYSTWLHPWANVQRLDAYGGW
ncbi:MAG: hypothetical protein ACT4PV_04955 [Planctomycetaceae bacterium]